MSNKLQIAHFWKRIAAWMFDGFLLAVLAVAVGALLSGLLGYNGYSDTVTGAYDRYETEYGVTFALSQEEYDALSEEELARYEQAYEALIADEEAMSAYNMVMNLTLVILSVALLAAVAAMEWLIPTYLGNGQTLGKKIFSLCVVRNDGVKINGLQLFTRSILGKYTIELIIPVLICLMIFWGTMGVAGTLILAVLSSGQLGCVLFTRTHSAIHDLMAGTVVVDYGSQTIFRTTEDLIEHQKRVAAQRAARSPY